MSLNQTIVIILSMIISIISSFIGGYQLSKSLSCKKCKNGNIERDKSYCNWNDSAPFFPDKINNKFYDHDNEIK